MSYEIGVAKTTPFSFACRTDYYIFAGKRSGLTCLGVSMASNAVIRRHVDPDIFKEFIKSKGVSIRQLGTLCQTNEKSIRRILQDKEVTLNVALDLCKYFNCNFNQIFGEDTSPEWKRSVIDILKRVR